jgi:hypothetical protein
MVTPYPSLALSILSWETLWLFTVSGSLRARQKLRNVLRTLMGQQTHWLQTVVDYTELEVTVTNSIQQLALLKEDPTAMDTLPSNMDGVNKKVYL